ncbi:MAG: zf-HC2 domain-containing protein [Lachnospiraceae bacterium]|nr:zf-HC2 domain-containing protein [Lachnospiraceae bacterium]
MTEIKENYCEVVQDLLPLYQDDICSKTSKKIVEEHLKGCADCSKLAKMLNNTDIDKYIEDERDSVLLTHEKSERRKTTFVGTIVACVLMVPVLVCLICNLAIGHALDWFYIVLASLLVVASLTVVPLVVTQKRFLWTLFSCTATTILLFGVICIFVRGDWFFMVTVSCLLGLSVVFLPYVIRNIPLPGALKNHKALIVMLIDTIGVYALIFVIGLYVGGDRYYWTTGLMCTTFGVLFPWAALLIYRYLKIHALAKTGLFVMVVGLFTAFSNDIIRVIVEGVKRITILAADFSDWSNVEVTNANIYVITLSVSFLVGIILIILGAILKNSRRNKV